MAQKQRKGTHYYVNKRIKAGNFSFFMISTPEPPQKKSAATFASYSRTSLCLTKNPFL